MTSSALVYCWIDLELTGLDTELDDIVEIGVIGTTVELDILFEKKIVIRASEDGIARILSNPIVTEMATKSGLLADLTAPDHADLPSVSDAESTLLALLDEYPGGDHVVLAGSGVWHCDLRFLRQHMPSLASRFDDREILDVGSMRRAFKRQTGFDLTEANGQKDHRADTDIRCSLEEGRAFARLFNSLTRNPA